MDVVLTPGAGLAVHQQTVMACRVTPEPRGQQVDGLLEVQACGPRTRDWWAWSDGWSAAGVTHVAMASPGADGQPVSHLRAGTWTVLVVKAAQVTHVPGRQTDRAEARWRAHLRRQGWLQARVSPRAEPRERRDLRRSRTQVVPERRCEVNRVPGVLARATIQVAAVASERMGVSGRAILAAVLAGRAAPAAAAAGLRAGPARVGAGASPTMGGEAAGPDRCPGGTA
jgi:transposase